jgi:hypothetical protein
LQPDCILARLLFSAAHKDHVMTPKRFILSGFLALLPLRIALGATETLFSFHYTKTGGFPSAGVVEDSQGNLYGTASAGGG